MPLSDTARSILPEASQHPLGIAEPLTTLPAAARHAVLRSLLRQGLVADYSAPAEHPDLGWRRADGTMTVMQITEAGRHAIGYGQLRNAAGEVELSGPTHVESEGKLEDDHDPVAAAGIMPANGPTEPHSDSLSPPTKVPWGSCGKGVGGHSKTPRGESQQFRLREAAQAVLAAWATPEQPRLAGAIDALQAALASNRPSPKDAAARVPRQNTKRATVLALLRRSEGASGPQLIKATGWASHTVRGFLAGLGRMGTSATVLDRVRQVGPNKAGAKGSYTIYRHRRGRLMLASRNVSPRYAVGLTRVSTAEQGQSGLGLKAQQASVRAFCAAQGWTLVADYNDIASGKDDHRPGFQAALARSRQLGAVLVAARLDRITRRAHTLSQLLEDGYPVRAADMPGADDLMMQIYAAMGKRRGVGTLRRGLAL